MVSTRCLRGVGSFSSTNPRPALAATSRKRIAAVGSSRPGCANKRTRRSVATRLDPIHIKRSAAVRNISKSLYFKGKLCRSPTLYSDEKSTIWVRSEEHTSELQSLAYLVCRLLLEKKKKHKSNILGDSD